MNYNVIINCSWKFTIVTVSDGEKIVYYSGSKLDFSSNKEQNRQIASNLARECLDYLKFNSVTKVPITVKGPQFDVRYAFIDEFMNSGIELMYISDITPIPHNMCRPPKARDRIPKMKKLTIGMKPNERVTN